MQKLNENALNELPRAPKQPDDQPVDTKQDEPVDSNTFWSRIKWLHERGLWGGDYREYEKPYYNLNKGAHYYVMENSRRRTIKCISCPVSHGGILEAHLLTRYSLGNGVLFFDGKPTNTTPDGFIPSE